MVADAYGISALFHNPRGFGFVIDLTNEPSDEDDNAIMKKQMRAGHRAARPSISSRSRTESSTVIDGAASDGFEDEGQRLEPENPANGASQATDVDGTRAGTVLQPSTAENIVVQASTGTLKGLGNSKAVDQEEDSPLSDVSEDLVPTVKKRKKVKYPAGSGVRKSHRARK